MSSKSVRLWDERFYLPALALALLLLALFRRGASFPAIVLLATLFFWAPPSYAAPLADLFLNRDQQALVAYDKGDFKDAMTKFDTPYRRGIAAYRAGAYDKAASLFKIAASQKDGLNALYDLGNAQLMQGQVEDAIASYETVLKQKPGHVGARHNLAIALKMLAQNRDENKKQNNQAKKNQGKSKQDQNTQQGRQQPQQQNKNGQRGSQSPQGGAQKPAQAKQSKDNQQATQQPKQQPKQQQGESQSKSQKQTGSQQPQHAKQMTAGRPQSPLTGASYNAQQRTPRDVNADEWLGRVQSDPGSFLKNQFMIEDRKSGLKQGPPPGWKPRLLFVVLLFFGPVPALAADFSATLGSDHVKSGESVSLQLTLSGANAGGAPDISALKQVFTVTSKLQPSNITIGTTAANTKVRWQLNLVPKRDGRLTVPPVTIETDAGMLRTAPVVLEVDQRSIPISSQTNIDGTTVSITALASTTKPYQNQSIRYTVRSELRGSVSDASLGDISVNNAIVAPEGQPDVRDAFENGSPVKIIEFHFIITPLQPGTLVIPPTVMQGKVRTPDITSMFGGGVGRSTNFFSAFGDAPFKVASNEVQLDVKPPATKMDPWLPLTSLRVLEDTTVSQSVQIGEPLVRKITLLADGAVGSQLPDLEAKAGSQEFQGLCR